MRDGVLAFAGHNLFKHAPALGELLAGAALGDEPDPLLAPPGKRSAGVADGDRHAHERAEAPVVVGDLDLPHPGRAAAVAAARLGVDRAFGDRAQEARLVRQALGHASLGDHRERGRHRGDRLGDRGEHAAVHEPHRLLDLVAHRHTRADALVADVDDLEAVQRVERLVQRDDRLEAHGSGTIAPAGQYAQARMSGIEDLPAEERAVLQLALRSDRPFHELAGVLELDEAEMRRHAHAALAALGPDGAAGLEPAQRDEIADWLLGQQSAEQRAGTERLVAGSAPARAWARVVADRLRGLGAQRLPDIPSADGNGAAAPAPAEVASASSPAAPTPAEPAAP